jgi:lipopolysaccharide/colanic/teichoic acid biosynthesis glycosyltransferase
MISMETGPQEFLLLMAKRLLDIVGGAVGLALCALAFPLYALWLKLVSPGPVLFRQDRLGRNGRRFVIYKFRTMCLNAEEKLTDLLHQNEMSGAIFKIRDDPRIITGGSFMRATHLDELPQFFNVIKGDMSLVGTRPPTPSEVEQYKAHHYRRLSMRPGLTGFWQLSGNKEVNDFDEVVRLDCQYIDNWSLWLDAKLLLRTCAEVFRAEGW